MQRYHKLSRRLLPIIAVCILLITSTGSAAHALTQIDWPMFGFDPAHSHYNPYEHTLSVSNVGNLTVQWQAPLSGENLFEPPAVVDGIVYVATKNTMLTALSATSHTVLWKFRLDRRYVTPPVVASGMVFVGGYHVYALNARTGALIWKRSTSQGVYALTVAQHLLYFSTASSGLCAYTLTGVQQWCKGGLFTTLTPAIASGVLYLSSNNTLSAHNATTGATLWTYTSSVYLDNAPTVANGMVYFCDGNATCYALNAASGAFMWSVPLAGSVQWSPAAAYGLVYISTDTPANTLYALNASTGAMVWSYTNASESFFASPVVANGVVYLGSQDTTNDGYLFAFDALSGAVLLGYDNDCFFFGPFLPVEHLILLKSF
jgi:eukaryotic-like serine/threonine-protein kinase